MEKKEIIKNIFGRASKSYKYIWFFSIVSLLNENKNVVLTYNKIVNRMIVVAYDLVIVQKMTFDDNDILQIVADYLSKKYPKAKITDSFFGTKAISEDELIAKYKRVLISNVPYKFLLAFLPKTNTIDWKLSHKSLIKQINEYPGLMYTFGDYDKFETKVILDGEWIEYIVNNTDEIVDIINEELVSCVFVSADEVNHDNILSLKDNQNTKISKSIAATETYFATPVKEQYNAFKFSNSEYSNQLERLCRDISYGDNIGLLLIDLFDNEEFIQTVHINAEREIEKLFNSYSGVSGGHSDLIFLSLVLIALNHYDSDYYTYVRETYNNLYNNHNSQTIESKIRDILRKYKRPDIDDSKRLITTVLMNAIVPKYFLPDFYDFAFDIYKVNLNYSNERVDDELEFIFKGLYQILKETEESDELKLNVRNTSYHLIQSTKKFIISEKDNNFENAIAYTKNIINIIHNNYLSESAGGFRNSYYKHGYDKWILKKQKTGEYSTDRRHRTGSFISRTHAFVVLDVNKKRIMLYPPEHKYRSDEIDFSNLYVKILNHNNVIAKDDLPDIIPIFGGNKVVSKPIEIDDPLDQLTYALYEGERKISSSNFNRKVFAFNADDGSEIKNFTDFEGEVIFCYKNSRDNNIKILKQTDKYKLGYASVSIGDVFRFENETFLFSKMVKPGIEAEKINGLKVKIKDSDYYVYKNFKSLVFLSDLQSDKIGISINGEKFRLGSFKYRVVEKELYHQYIVDLPIGPKGLFNIYAYQIKDNTKIKDSNFEFILDDDYSQEINRVSYDTYKLIINSSFSKTEMVFDINLDNAINFSYTITYSKIDYCFIPTLSLDLYSIDDCGWKLLSSSIWADDFNVNSILKIWGETSQILVIGMTNNSPSVLEPIPCKVNNGISVANIGSLKSLNSYPQIILSWNDLNGKQKGIWLDNNCKINTRKTAFDYNPISNSLCCNINYYGKGRVDLEIINLNSKEVYRKENIESGSIIEINNIEPFVEHNIRIINKVKNGLFKKDLEIYNREKIFYSLEGIENRSLELIEAEYYKLDNNGEYKKMIDIVNNTLIRNIRKIEDGKLIGDLCEKEYGAYIHKNKINPICIEIISEINDGVFDIAISHNNDQLVFDDKTKTIKDQIQISKNGEICLATVKII